ncbi:MAG: hypothetical protein KGS72_04670 [Cyanobacteria bacterium REEB67]|nr:hypothetical protein [Cyanobacteria bacterium REEB67]
MNDEISKEGDAHISVNDNTATRAREALSQQALSLFQCKDGSFVRNPQECRGTLDQLKLPGLSIG